MVQNPDFTIAVAPATQNVNVGSVASYTVILTPLSGFAENVNLSVTLPSGASGGSFSANPVPGGSGYSVLTFTVPSTTGTFTVTVTGTSALTQKAHSASATVVVQNPDFTIAVAPASQTVNVGTVATYTVTLAPLSGFTENVNLSVALPSGASGGSFSVNPVPGGSGSSVLTFTAPSTTGSFTVTVTGTSALTQKTHSASATVVVQNPDFSIAVTPATQTVNLGTMASYTVTLAPLSGFTENVNLSVTLPSGASAGAFSVNPVPGGSGSSVLTFTAPSTVGSFTVTVTGTSALTRKTHSTTATLVVPAPDFSIALTPASQTVNGGTKASYTVTLTPANGFAENVNFSASLPPGAGGASFSPNPIAGGSGSSALTFNTPTTPGSYTVTITGTSATTKIVHSATATVVIPTPDFSLSALPTSGTVKHGNSTSYTVSAVPSGGFTGAIALAATVSPPSSPPPSAPNVSFSPPQIAGGCGSSQMTAKTAGNTAPGTYTITITGTNGSTKHTTTVSLTVN